jgi:hypothetical protein
MNSHRASVLYAGAITNHTHFTTYLAIVNHRHSVLIPLMTPGEVSKHWALIIIDWLVISRLEPSVNYHIDRLLD